MHGTNFKIVVRTERHIIRENRPRYSLLKNICIRSKNLYNHANYIVRQEFINNGTWIRYKDLYKIVREDRQYPDYFNLPTTHMSNNVIMQLDENWSKFFKRIKKWGEDKTAFSGRPNIPSYIKSKDGYMVIVDQHDFRVRDGYICFPKKFYGYKLKPKCLNYMDLWDIKQVRFIPKKDYIIAEVVFEVEVYGTKADNGRYLSIDIGVDNLATVTNNFGEKPFIINGKGLKSVNVYYNKRIAHYQSIADKVNGHNYTKLMYRITRKRNFKMYDYMHKASRYIIRYAVKHDVSVIVVGHNVGWKEKPAMRKSVNQTFTQIPTRKLMYMLGYKGENRGIRVIETEESYTSGTSFLDNEMPVKENYNKKRRKKRGLFVSNTGQKINADVNGSLQILKKVFPNAYADGIGVVALQPDMVNVAVV